MIEWVELMNLEDDDNEDEEENDESSENENDYPQLALMRYFLCLKVGV